VQKTLVLSFCAAALLALSASAQTADELIDKSIKARGGLEKLKAVQAMKLTGKMKMGPIEAPFTVLKKRPENIRIEFTIQGMTGVQAYDGSTGWTLMPFLGKKDPEAMSADALKDFKDEADFDGPTVEYKKKGNKVELLGREDVQGTPAYKLKVTTREGNETIVYLDSKSYLDIKAVSKHDIEGEEMEEETTLGDYKDVGGLLFPFSIESHVKGHDEMARSITVEKVDLNPGAVDAAVFHMPKGEKPAAEGTKKQ
jgi:outer membrane lipoprotein-sorting protein